MITFLLCSFYFLLKATPALFFLTQPKPYGTKTTYEDSFTDTEYEAVNNVVFAKDNFYPSFCKPIQLNMVLRHGIRNPGDQDIENIKSLYNKLANSSSLSHPSVREIVEYWQPSFNLEEAKILNSLGYLEQRSIARRMKQLFPGLFQSSTSPLPVLFMSSSVSRTIDSCDAFASGLLGEKSNYKTAASIRNDLLRFFDDCDKYVETVEKNKDALNELHKFKKGVEYTAMLDRISAKMNLSASDIRSEVKSLYVTAAMEEAVLGSSLWSSLLKDQDLHVLEYAKDLKDYWKKGYGHGINYQQSCPLLRDVVHHMDDAVKGLQYKDGIFRCSHSETLLPFVSLLGLFGDKKPLQADNYNVNHNRQFRTSRIASFSANVAFVLYDCAQAAQSDSDSATRGHESANRGGDAVPGLRYPVWPPVTDRFMVQLLYKELPMKFPFCDYDLCPYSKVRQHYQHIIEQCDIYTICKLADAGRSEL